MGAASEVAVDVSVLVAVRNEERFIEDMATALLAQEFDGSLEFLLVDGQSEDGTRRILKELANDSELAARIIEDGGKIVSLPELSARYVPRSSLLALAPAPSLRLLSGEGGSPPTQCASPASAAPGAGAYPARRDPGAAAGAIAGQASPASYLALTLVAAVRSRAKRLSDVAALPLVFATMHFCWGWCSSLAASGFVRHCARSHEW